MPLNPPGPIRLVQILFLLERQQLSPRPQDLVQPLGRAEPDDGGRDPAVWLMGHPRRRSISWTRPTTGCDAEASSSWYSSPFLLTVNLRLAPFWSQGRASWPEAKGAHCKLCKSERIFYFLSLSSHFCWNGGKAQGDWRDGSAGGLMAALANMLAVIMMGVEEVEAESLRALVDDILAKMEAGQ